jgi:hypothetical protein
MATWNKHAALETAHKLRALHPTLLAVGHGNVMTNPLTAIDQAIIQAKKALR